VYHFPGKAGTFRRGFSLVRSASIGLCGDLVDAVQSIPSAEMVTLMDRCLSLKTKLFARRNTSWKSHNTIWGPLFRALSACVTLRRKASNRSDESIENIKSFDKDLGSNASMLMNSESEVQRKGPTVLPERCSEWSNSFDCTTSLARIPKLGYSQVGRSLKAQPKGR
jgi:hypothetical protein